MSKYDIDIMMNTNACISCMDLHGTMENSTRQNMPQVFKIHLLAPETALRQ